MYCYFLDAETCMHIIESYFLLVKWFLTHVTELSTSKFFSCGYAESITSSQCPNEFETILIENLPMV